MTSLCRAKRGEVQALGEQVDLYTEAVAAKDHVVVELTNQVSWPHSSPPWLDHFWCVHVTVVIVTGTHAGPLQ